jgi:hypothetical protein
VEGVTQEYGEGRLVGREVAVMAAHSWRAVWSGSMVKSRTEESAEP